MSETVNSAYSSVLNVSGWGDFPWLKDLFDPSLNMEFEITGDEFAWSEDKGQGSFDPVGRRIAITITDEIKGAVFDGFTAALVTSEEEAAFDAIWASNHTLLLQLPDSRQWFIQLKRRKKRLPPGTGPFMYVDVSATEADEPDVF